MTTDTRALQTSATSPAIAEAIEVLDRIKTVRDTLAPDLNDQELQLFALVAQRSGLDPFAKQLYAIKRKGRVTFQTGIDGYRSVAARTGQYEGTSDPEFGPWLDKPFQHPEWARVIAYRWQNGRLIEQPATVYWSEYYPGDDQGFMWKTKPRVMLGKVAEAVALRKAFPYVLADVYVAEEMDQAGPGDSAPLVAAAAQPTAAERIAARRAAIEGTEPDTTIADAAEAIFREDDVAVCGWKVETKAGIVACTMPADHDGEHEWHDVAVKEGGKVIRPDA